MHYDDDDDPLRADHRNMKRLDELTQILLDPDSDEFDRKVAIEERDQLKILSEQAPWKTVKPIPDENERLRDRLAQKRFRRDFPDALSEEEEEEQREYLRMDEEAARLADLDEAEERRLEREDEFEADYERELQRDPNFAKREFINRQDDLQRDIGLKLEEEDPEGPESNFEIENRLYRKWGALYTHNPSAVRERDSRVRELMHVRGEPWSFRTFDKVCEQMDHELTLAQHKLDRGKL